MKLFITAVTAIGATLALSAPAIASPAQPASMNGPLAYPAAVCSTISVSTTHPAPGQKIAVVGTAFRPDTAVELQLTRKNSAAKTAVRTAARPALSTTVRSDSRGGFRTSITMPESATSKGVYSLAAVSGYEAGGSCPADPVASLLVGLAGEEDNTSAGGTDGAATNDHGGTAFTGVDVLVLIALAAGLLVAGGELMRRGRRRSSL